MTDNEKTLMWDLINQASDKINLLQDNIKEKNAEISELKAKVKQAKIDILNKLKERLYSIFVTKSSPLGDITVEDIAEDIDELIKEVKMPKITIKVDIDLINNDKQGDTSKCYGCRFIDGDSLEPYCMAFNEYLPVTHDSFFNRLEECKNNEVQNGEDKG